MSKIYVIHENEDWVLPLRAAFDKLEIPYAEWFIDEMTLDLSSIPPEGVFYNRMSASAHTRDHRYAPEMTGNILAWLELHGRTVINGRRALQLELRKSEQYIALQKAGIPHPKTVISNSIASLPQAVDTLFDIIGQKPFILKPNRGGKGTGVQQFFSKASLRRSIENDDIGTSLDGIWLVQEYIKPPSGRIVRAEFVGGEFLYAVSIDATGGFELCPADACSIEDMQKSVQNLEGAFCPADQSQPEDKFVVLDDAQGIDIDGWSTFLKSNDIQVGAMEYVEDEAGQKFVYDINTNTNYNSAAEARSTLDKEGMLEIACFLGRLLIIA